MPARVELALSGANFKFLYLLEGEGRGDALLGADGGAQRRHRRSVTSSLCQACCQGLNGLALENPDDRDRLLEVQQAAQPRAHNACLQRIAAQLQ